MSSFFTGDGREPREMNRAPTLGNNKFVDSLLICPPGGPFRAAGIGASNEMNLHDNKDALTHAGDIRYEWEVKDVGWDGVWNP